MCGIVCLLDAKQKTETLRPQILQMSRKVRNRGSDWSGNFQDENEIFSHERLAIVDPASGKQPLFTKDGKVVLAVNGEIYNHRELRAEFPDYDFLTQSDCEVILALYRRHGKDFLEKLNGIFAFALYDSENGVYLVGRDHMGICPLYQGWDRNGNYYVASELKALEGICKSIEVFLPGHFLFSAEGFEMQKWYHRDWEQYNSVEDNVTDISKIRKGLEAAVHRQLMSDVPYGVLLSGGLDSSIIAAVTAKYARNRIESGDQVEVWYARLHRFAVRLEGSRDLVAARKASDHRGSIHHEVRFAVQ